jgi:hypothetical protein
MCPSTMPVCMKMWVALGGLTLLSAMLIAGCTGIQNPGGVAGSATRTVAAQASVAPTLAIAVPNGTAGSPAVLIVDPAFDGGIAAGTVTVSVQVTGFALVRPGAPNRQGTGHLVYYRDATPRTMQGETALTAPDTCAASAETAYTWEGVAPGTHTFAVQLVNGDDTPLDPPTIDAVDVTAVSPGMVRTG